jgi:peptidoglycan/LPS O-acetylase OafA/YrhL
MGSMFITTLFLQYLKNFRVHNSIGNFIIISLLRVGFSFLFAELSFIYMERPLLKFKKRWNLQR